MIKKSAEIFIVALLLFVVFDAFVWWQIVFAAPDKNPKIYFLDVGQGDAELLVLPVGIKILTDAGPDAKVSKDLENILPAADRYIDVGIISHPQLDHFNGYNYLLDNYNFGVFIFNGRMDSPGVAEWPSLLQKIKSKNIPLITLGGGDKISYGKSEIDFLSPSKDFIQSAELNDTAFVELVKTGFLKALLTSDIGFNVENYLLEKFASEKRASAQGLRQSESAHPNDDDVLKADILKVAHHGSKYSSGSDFLRAVDPEIAVIEVGANNKYGHPTAEALARLASSTSARLFRTDRDGTVEVAGDNNGLKVYFLKN